MILFVDPYQEGLVLVVEDASRIGPITSCSAVGQDITRGRLLEEESLFLEVILRGLE